MNGGPRDLRPRGFGQQTSGIPLGLLSPHMVHRARSGSPSHSSDQTIEERSPDMNPATRQRFRLSGGTELSFITAGEASRPAVLLLHGSPSSARMFREVIPGLSRVAYVIAPDLPGFGESDVLPSPSFPALGQAISELLDWLSIGPRYVYLHDYGAP